MFLLAKASMRNRALIALITIIAAVFGGLALSGLKQELAPSIQFPQLAVLSTYPGASPDVVNQDVSAKLEAAIQGVPNVDSTTATSSTNLSLISVSFVYGTDLLLSEQKINQAISRVKSQLPDGVDPQVISGSLGDFPIIQVAVSADVDKLALANDLRNSTIQKIKDLSGVRNVELIGAPKQRVVITPDLATMQANGISVGDLKTTLDNNGLLIPGGLITENDTTLSIQIGERLTSVDAISALPIAVSTPTGIKTIGDVSNVSLAEDPRTTISRVNGKEALTLAVTKLPSANTVDVSKAVRALLPELETSLGNGSTFTVVFDQAPFIQKSIESLTQEGLLGLVFAVIIILIFLMSVRSTIVTAISIPTSVLITFIGLQGSNYTLNILTLGALTIAIGRVVDDSIVVIENIKRHLVPGADKEKVIVDAVREVAGAVTASTATTVAVFLPIAFVSGVTGQLFRPFALTITIALVASLVVSLTIVPVLAYWFLRPTGEWQLKRLARKGLSDSPAAKAIEAERASGEEKPGLLRRGYQPILNWTLKYSALTLVLAIAVLGGTVALVPFMKTNFLGSSGQNTFTVTQEISAGTSLDAQDAQAVKVQQALADTPGISIVQASVGSSGNALRDAFVGGGDTKITYSVTTDAKADQELVQADARANISKEVPIDAITIAASSGFGGSSDISLRITAPSAEKLTEATETVATAMRDVSAVKQVATNLSASRPFISVAVDRDAAAAAGYSEVALAGMVSAQTRPGSVGTVEIDGSLLNVYIAYDSPPATLAELQALEIPTARGPVRLDTLATIGLADGPTTVTTVKGQRSATVTVTPNSADLGTASAAVTQALAKIDLPAGTAATVGGATSDQQTAFSQLGLALLAAILVVYVIMVATFRSLLQPLLLLVSIPFAATGAIALQVVTGVPLGVASLIGVLMLVGIVVTNAIVLIDLVNQYRRKGLAVREALIEGAGRRLRPILMTALATVFALVPLALGLTGSGGFISQPLAIVVIGGLLSSTVLTLVVLPVLYNLVEGARERGRAKRAAKRGNRGKRAETSKSDATSQATGIPAPMVD
jgi:HAE1 family hydrophobic/amphiphilic exporter-1